MKEPSKLSQILNKHKTTENPFTAERQAYYEQTIQRQAEDLKNAERMLRVERARNFDETEELKAAQATQVAQLNGDLRRTEGGVHFWRFVAGVSFIGFLIVSGAKVVS